MPTYEYKCDKCGNEFKAIRKISERDHAKCPNCGDENTHKKMSPVTLSSKVK